MPIKKIMLEDKTFGNIKFLQHVRTLNKRGTQEAEYEIYEMASSVYGSIQVYISSKVTKVKPKYLRQVELIKPYVIPRSNVMTIDNKKRANVEYTLFMVITLLRKLKRQKVIMTKTIQVHYSYQVKHLSQNHSIQMKLMLLMMLYLNSPLIKKLKNNTCTSK